MISNGGINQVSGEEGIDSATSLTINAGRGEKRRRKDALFEASHMEEEMNKAEPERIRSPIAVERNTSRAATAETENGTKRHSSQACYFQCYLSIIPAPRPGFPSNRPRGLAFHNFRLTFIVGCLKIRKWIYTN